MQLIALCGAVECRPAGVKALGLTAAGQLKMTGESLAESLSRTPLALENPVFELLKTMGFNR